MNIKTPSETQILETPAETGEKPIESAYAQIRKQIPCNQAGKFEITCPCGQPGRAHVSKVHMSRPRNHRRVKTTCRHCRTQYTFVNYL